MDEVLRQHALGLQKLFVTALGESLAREGRERLSFEQFVSFCHAFSVMPAFLSRLDAVQVFTGSASVSASRADPMPPEVIERSARMMRKMELPEGGGRGRHGAPHGVGDPALSLGYGDFLDCVVRVADRAFGVDPWRELHDGGMVAEGAGGRAPLLSAAQRQQTLRKRLLQLRKMLFSAGPLPQQAWSQLAGSQRLRMLLYVVDDDSALFPNNKERLLAAHHAAAASMAATAAAAFTPAAAAIGSAVCNEGLVEGSAGVAPCSAPPGSVAATAVPSPSQGPPADAVPPRHRGATTQSDIGDGSRQSSQSTPRAAQQQHSPSIYLQATPQPSGTARRRDTTPRRAYAAPQPMYPVPAAAMHTPPTTGSSHTRARTPASASAVRSTPACAGAGCRAGRGGRQASPRSQRELGTSAAARAAGTCASNACRAVQRTPGLDNVLQLLFVEHAKLVPVKGCGKAVGVWKQQPRQRGNAQYPCLSPRERSVSLNPMLSCSGFDQLVRTYQLVVTGTSSQVVACRATARAAPSYQARRLAAAEGAISFGTALARQRRASAHIGGGSGASADQRLLDYEGFLEALADLAARRRPGIPATSSAALYLLLLRDLAPAIASGGTSRARRGSGTMDARARLEAAAELRCALVEPSVVRRFLGDSAVSQALVHGEAEAASEGQLPEILPQPARAPARASPHSRHLQHSLPECAEETARSGALGPLSQGEHQYRPDAMAARPPAAAAKPAVGAKFTQVARSLQAFKSKLQGGARLSDVAPSSTADQVPRALSVCERERPPAESDVAPADAHDPLLPSPPPLPPPLQQQQPWQLDRSARALTAALRLQAAVRSRRALRMVRLERAAAEEERRAASRVSHARAHLALRVTVLMNNGESGALVMPDLPWAGDGTFTEARAGEAATVRCSAAAALRKADAEWDAAAIQATTQLQNAWRGSRIRRIGHASALVSALARASRAAAGAAAAAAMANRRAEAAVTHGAALVIQRTASRYATARKKARIQGAALIRRAAELAATAQARRDTATSVQSLYRGYLARRGVRMMLQLQLARSSAVKIQKCVRGIQTRRSLAATFAAHFRGSTGAGTVPFRTLLAEFTCMKRSANGAARRIAGLLRVQRAKAVVAALRLTARYQTANGDFRLPQAAAPMSVSRASTPSPSPSSSVSNSSCSAISTPDASLVASQSTMMSAPAPLPQQETATVESSLSDALLNTRQRRHAGPQRPPSRPIDLEGHVSGTDSSNSEGAPQKKQDGRRRPRPHQPRRAKPLRTPQTPPVAPQPQEDSRDRVLSDKLLNMRQRQHRGKAKTPSPARGVPSPSTTTPVRRSPASQQTPPPRLVSTLSAVVVKTRGFEAARAVQVHVRECAVLALLRARMPVLLA